MKYNSTLRDSLAYFVSGSILLTFVFFLYSKEILEGINQMISDYNTRLISIPLAVISIVIPLVVGHIIASIDYLIFHLGANRLPRIRNRFFDYLNGYRISGSLKLKNRNISAFWKDCAKLQSKEMYGKPEYWYISNDLFKNLIVVGIIVLTLMIERGNLCLIYVPVLIIFLLHNRARFFASNFIQSVSDNIELLNESNETEMDFNLIHSKLDAEGFFVSSDYGYDDLLEFWQKNGVITGNKYKTKEIAFRKYLESHPKNAIIIRNKKSGEISAACIVFYNGRKGSVERLGVNEKNRRSGLSGLILELAEKRCMQLGAHKVYCLIEESNIISQKFFSGKSYTLMNNVNYLVKEL